MLFVFVTGSSRLHYLRCAGRAPVWADHWRQCISISSKKKWQAGLAWSSDPKKGTWSLGKAQRQYFRMYMISWSLLGAKNLLGSNVTRKLQEKRDIVIYGKLPEILFSL